MIVYRKHDFPVENVRRFLEPGPVVLLSSACKGETNVMTLGWHAVMEFTPSRVGCVISRANHSFEMIRRSRQCVINIPAVDLARSVVGIGNCSGADTDKFARFKLTPVAAAEVAAPLIAQCFASFECRVADTRLVNAFDFFVLEVVRAHVARATRPPRTLHYRGDGVFMLSGESLNLRRQFKPQML